MNLTAAQIDLVKDGEPITLLPPEIGVECVIVRADVYVRGQVSYDDGEFSPREAYPFVDRVMTDDDANDPGLERYQEYGREP